MQPLTLLASIALYGAGAVHLVDDPTDRGELLLGELRCTACHVASPALERRIAPKAAPRLDGVSSRVSPNWLTTYLNDPQSCKPGATMPDVLGALSDPERAEAVEALTHFFLIQGGAFEAARVSASMDELEAGRALFHEIGCIACHEPLEEGWALELSFTEAQEERALFEEEGFEEEGFEEDQDFIDGPPPISVPLGALARKWSVDSLSDFMSDPHATRPSGRMPSLRLNADEARAISLYLLRDQALGERSELERFGGLAFEYYEEDFGVDAPRYTEFIPARTGVAEHLDSLPDHRSDHFGFRFTGSLDIETEGEYTFATTSDDGSRLYIDGRLVVKNDGTHAPQEESGTIQLAAGSHAIEVTMFERSGGEELSVMWAPPGVEKATIPAELLSHVALAYEPVGFAELIPDGNKAEAGAHWFQSLRCWSCHESDAPGLAGAATPRPPRRLADLDPNAPGGCLATHPADGAPRYSLSDADRTALRVVLTDLAALEREPAPAHELALTLERMRCTACHSRGGQGGPAFERRPYFKERGHWDLGDQGRIPPHLDEPGSKLTKEWLEKVLFEGGASRDYVATRMPQYGAENIARLPALFREVDAKPNDLVEPAFALEEVENGRRLAGRDGLGCIQCHKFAGHDSLGIPAVDLARVSARIQPGWFERLMRDPVSINMNSRMPEFWVQGASPVADVHGGDIEAQIDALWVYLSLGDSMPMPDGLVVPDEEFELVVGDEPRTVGVFMKGVSPRTLCVGFPLGTHYAYDMQGSRLAKAWRGRFFNARGTWEARAGELQSPPVGQVFDLPTEPLLARLDSEGAPWPARLEKQPGYRVLGRRFDAERRPVFRYKIGEVFVEEHIHPELREGGSYFVRELIITSELPVDDLWYRPTPIRLGEPGASPRRVEFERGPDGRQLARITEEFTW